MADSPSVVERFIGQAQQEARAADTNVEDVIHQHLDKLSELVGGYDFAEVIAAYWRGHDQGDTNLKASAVRWLRGEYATRTDARRDLGVRTIVDDGNVYDQLKLLARFVRLAGYTGLVVALDELVNLYKLANTRARSSNYEQILRILNDCLQGTVSHLGFLMAGNTRIPDGHASRALQLRGLTKPAQREHVRLRGSEGLLGTGHSAPQSHAGGVVRRAHEAPAHPLRGRPRGVRPAR